MKPNSTFSLILMIGASMLVPSAYTYIFNKTLIIKPDFLTSAITILSIIFGFYIASLAFFATSKFVATLYKDTDKSNPSKTLLHTLIGNYHRGLIIILFTISYFISIQFILDQGSDLYHNIWIRYYAKPLLGVLIINFIYSYLMLKDLINIILQEAKLSQLK